MDQLKVYSNPDIYQVEDRFFLNNIIKAQWKDNPAGRWPDLFIYESDLQKADIYLLT